MSEMVRLTQAFDDATYLKLNPDVREAVKSGLLSSGWQHFVTYGCNENRPGVSVELRRKTIEFFANLTADTPLPPPSLRKRVHGDDQVLSFEYAGKAVAVTLSDAIKEAGLVPGKDSRVLDFGCGK